MSEFLQRDLTSVGKRVHRLGLSASFGIDEASIRSALDRGINYLYLTLRTEMEAPLRDALKRDREKVVLATGPLVGWFGGSVRRSCERTLKALGTEQIDIFLLQWLGVTSAFTDDTIRELRHLKESGKVRAIGCSIHDRLRAAELVKDSPLDVFMLRYNAAHPGAEREIFPHLAVRKPDVVAYTATSWRKLLKAPKGWDGPAMTAGDCYRFCLSNPSVSVVLCGPSSRAQLDENLAAVEKGAFTDDELTRFRAYGKVVHG